MGSLPDLESIVRFFVTSATSLLLVFVALGVKFPSSREYSRMRLAKYLICLSFLCSGLQIFFWTKIVSSTPLILSFRYLIDSVSYAFLLAVPVLIVSRKPNCLCINVYMWLLAVLCVLLQVLFTLTYPVFGLSCRWGVIAANILTFGLIVAMGAYYGWLCRSLQMQGRPVRKWITAYFGLVMLSVVYFQALLPQSEFLHSVSMWPSILFTLLNAWFVVKLNDYAYQIRLNDSVSGISMKSESDSNSVCPQVPDIKPEAAATVPSEIDDEGQLRLQKALEEWIQAKKFLEQDEGIETVAEQLGTDLKTFRQYFRTKVRVDFRTWRIALRIEYAKECMKDNPGISVNRLSEMAGFATKSNFYHYFKQITGETPAEYREHLIDGDK